MSVFSNPYFKLLLWINCTVCALSLVVMIWASSFEKADGDMPKAKERIFVICQYAFISTVGAFGGLLCGRAAIPDQAVASGG
jgi:hypothetical protein